ncbi:hypothetical protein F5Y18DRAFT_416488 [Xylariaceae sp. FL1019]|nr:hypothetical protein F5Y18DRAFT_416488 [Xylariaceae sp. FL1019]
MAGPGGGPSRRSHTKSRKGCESCKRRHIRCDENFPQCRNCTKHKVRCPYNDAPPDEKASTPDRPLGPDLMLTPQIEAAILDWQQSGEFPFPNLVYPAPNPKWFTFEQLCLIFHVAAICYELNALDANGVTIWTRHIPTILAIGASHRYVIDALLAFSAEHIANLTNCPIVGSMAFEYRGMAFKGLQEAISTFSPENADAVLACSLVLSWQATDWKTWTQLMQGTSSIIDAMEPFKHESKFTDFINESSTFPTAPPSPQPDRKPKQPHKDDLDAFQRNITQLAKVEAYLKQHKADHQLIQQLAQFLKGARKVSPIQSIEEQFDRLRPLRTWLFWLPVDCLQSIGFSPSSLVVIGHYYTAAMMMERLFPEIGAAYFGSMSIAPLEEIAKRLLSFTVAGNNDTLFAEHLSLMEYPINTIAEFRYRQGWHQPIRTPSFPQFDQPNFVMTEHISHETPPMTATYLPYAGSPAFTLSTEDLSTPAPEHDSGSAASPMTLSSPYLNGHYLGIPSPSFAPYSPTSSFGEGSTGYSDHEEYGPFDSTYDGAYDNYMSFCSPEPNNLGVGFVSPVQSVWI